MECDHTFGLTEKSKKHQQDVFAPNEWVNTIAHATSKFTVEWIETDHFVSTEPMNDVIRDNITGLCITQ